MSDDWRLRMELGDKDSALGLGQKLEAGELDHDLEVALHDRIVVTHSDTEVFVYTDTREQAERAEEVIHTVSKENGWALTVELRHWHPSAEEWEDPDRPLPATDAASAKEHADLIAQERTEAQERGTPEFEVRIECPSHREMLKVVDRLRGEGLLPVHRWRYALVGEADEDSANALAERLRGELPEGSTVTVEGTWQAVQAERPSNPFAIFGGLGN